MSSPPLLLTTVRSRTPERRYASISFIGCAASSKATDEHPREPHSRVGLHVLHNDNDLPIRTFRDRVPDSQTVQRKMKTVRTWQRVCRCALGHC
jgi:hypothetical protein